MRGVACSQQRTRGSLVQTRGLDAHKLPVAVSGDFGIEDLCQRQVRNNSSSKDGHQHGCGMHQQPGRYSIQGSGGPHEGAVDVVPAERISASRHSTSQEY